MSMTTAAEAPVKTVSTQELRAFVDDKRPLQFWNVLTDEWFKGKTSPARAACPSTK
jgi:hypothetical protein